VTVKKLSAGSVVFEDLSESRYKGHVIKSIGLKSLNNSVDGHLTGMIEYQGKTDTHEVLFGDRDMEDDINLQKGIAKSYLIIVVHPWRKSSFVYFSQVENELFYSISIKLQKCVSLGNLMHA